MTALPQTAEAFARECLGWDDIEWDCLGLYVSDRSCPAPPADMSKLYVADVSSVLAAVRGWCDSHNAQLAVGYGRYAAGDWDVMLSTAAGTVTCLGRDLPTALMAACVEAGRKLAVTT